MVLFVVHQALPAHCPGRDLDSGQGRRGHHLKNPPKAAEDIFSQLEQTQGAGGGRSELAVIISFYEIYCGKLFDLLNRRQLLHARENAKSRVVIVGLTETRVSNVRELMHVIEFGLQSRTTGVTGRGFLGSRVQVLFFWAVRDKKIVKSHGDLHTAGVRVAPRPF